MFQHIISEQIRDIPVAINISDDLGIFGTTQEAHDKVLEAVLEQFASKGLTLNRSNCEFSKSSITFFGLVFSAAGARQGESDT